MRIWATVLTGILCLSGCTLLEEVEEPESADIATGMIRQTPVLGMQERYLYVNVGSLGLDIFDVTDAASPQLVKNYSVEEATYALAMYASYLFLANGTQGVEVLDITRPESPQRIGFVRTDEENATAVSVSPDGREIAIGTDESIWLYDISTIQTPRYLGRTEMNATIYDVAFDTVQPYLYAANARDGLLSLDISVPSRMTIDDVLTLEGSIRDIQIDSKERYAYTATLTSALKRVDIQDPQNLDYDIVYDWHDGSQLWSITSESDGIRLYLAKGEEGFAILQKDPNGLWSEAGSFDTNGSARGVAVNSIQNRAYIADGDEGLKIFDITDKSNPFRLGYIKF